MADRLIFQLGTNNWQRQGEFAPGSGILHEAHHNAYNAMAGVGCYSIYPSRRQTSDDPKVRVFPLNHDIPICESVSPVSSYRFHGMSEDDFGAYIDRLLAFTTEAINDAESREGRDVDLAIAHHSFLNPVVLSRINSDRIARSRRPFKLMCFVHGTALKMFAHEKAGLDPDYPLRFLPFMQSEGVFADGGKVDFCAAISSEQLDRFGDVFPGYPAGQMILSLNGYDTDIFRPDTDAYRDRATILSGMALAPSPLADAPKRLDHIGEKVVVFCGKFADWKRLDVLLEAAARYEQEANISTLIIGSGPDDAIEHYHRLAYEKLGLQNTWFVGPKPHAEIAQLNALADVGVYPSRDEPFGLVLIECMACGTPVIGADSGGPRDFVDSGVGVLVDEGEGDILVARLTATVLEALRDDWKSSRGPAAAERAARDFSVSGQCRSLLGATGISPVSE